MKKIVLTLGFIVIVYAQNIYATFNVEAIKHSIITVDARGIVENIYVKVGQKVKKKSKTFKTW